MRKFMKKINPEKSKNLIPTKKKTTNQENKIEDDRMWLRINKEWQGLSVLFWANYFIEIKKTQKIVL